MASIFQMEPMNSNYHSPTPGKITLVAGHPNTGNAALDYALCKGISDCGFNAVAAIIGYSDEDESKKYNIPNSLENCRLNNLKLLLQNASVQYSSFVNTYKGNIALGGWMLKNQASWADALGNTDIKTYCDLLKGYDPDHSIFIGLGGDWERQSNNSAFLNPSQGIENSSVATYTNYILNFQENFQPSLWPVAYFPDLTLMGSIAVPSERFDMFYKSLRYFSIIARYTAVPFWAFCRCQGFHDNYGFNASTPTVESMRWAVFSALAYGAQGIFYWNYCQNENGQTTVYANAPIDRNGKPTATGGYVKLVNEDVAAYNDIFCGCEMVDCRHLSSRSGMNWIKRFMYPVGPLMGITSADGSDLHLLISHIHNKGKDYLVVVSEPFTTSGNPSTSTQVLRLEFNEYWSVKRLKRTGTGYTSESVSNTTYQVSLERGNVMIFEWE